MSETSMLRVRELKKVLPSGKVLLDGVNMKVDKGEFVGVLGPSGAGKSLTLRCILGLTRMSSGRVEFEAPDGVSYAIGSLNSRQLRKARRHIGVIFQGLNLVQQLTALENVMIGRLGCISPLRSWLYGFTDTEAVQAYEALKEVGMESYAGRRVHTLSGGEAQRVAIARAIFQKPAFYLADEPISNLDPKNAKAIMKILARLAKDTPVLGVFHQPEMTFKYCDRIVAIKDGKVAYEGSSKLSATELAGIYGEELSEIDDNAECYGGVQTIRNEPETKAKSGSGTQVANAGAR